jgi:permease family protein
MIDRLFRLSENKTNVHTEALAGLTTFLTMAYIIFVQPAVLSGKMFGTDTGMDFGAVTTATCVSAALATAIMGLYARYPIAQAPGMGENFFFVFSALPAATAAGFTNGWQVALGVVFVSGVLFLILSLIGLRELIFNAAGRCNPQGFGYCRKTECASRVAGFDHLLRWYADDSDLACASRTGVDSLGHRRGHSIGVPAQTCASAHALCRVCGSLREQVHAQQALRICKRVDSSAAINCADISQNGRRGCADAEDASVCFCLPFHAHV